jgi:hypothetical protein
MRSTGQRALPWLLMAALLADDGSGGACLAAAPAAPPRSSQGAESNLLLFEVRLGDQVLSDAVTAYQIGKDVFLPLGELSRLLTWRCG